MGQRWLVVWLGSRPAGNGDWLHCYSIAPGVRVTLTSRPGPGMLPPHDASYLPALAAIAAAYPASA